MHDLLTSNNNVLQINNRWTLDLIKKKKCTAKTVFIWARPSHHSVFTRRRYVGNRITAHNLYFAIKNANILLN